MGNGDALEQARRAPDVWLLIDGQANDMFLTKTSKVCVCLSPEKTKKLLEQINAIPSCFISLARGRVHVVSETSLS